ncbi:MAG: (d)CMP kinase [Chloroflexi bacterium]|nr:(d)CMP kinase [Chloroflexota bacterium]
MRFERLRTVPSRNGGLDTIAIDGPVAVGKSTVGLLIAKQLGYSYIDTGALYRALTYKVLLEGVSHSDEEKIIALADSTRITLSPSGEVTNGYRVFVDGRDASEQIRGRDVEAAVSLVSRIPAVRRKLVELQREMAAQGKVVVVGRDIGTVVLPDAGLKVFLTASPEERARRRHLETMKKGDPRGLDEVLAELQTRDRLDSTRDDSPLRPARDALTIDTTDLSIEETAGRIMGLIEGKCR